MQNYKETLEWLFSQLPMYQRQGQAAYKANLDNTLELDTYFGYPHRQFKCIHVAGTNGKGSVSHSLASVLQENGYKVGLYTSPHLVDFRERIKVNGEMIEAEFIVDFVNENRSFFEKLKPSFFEMTVAMAFLYFAQQKVDFAVLEVGMGGRLDSTNIVSPLISIITNISFDHTQFLGDTLANIAAEKAGIIKKGVPVVIGEKDSETKSVYLQKGMENGSALYFAEDFYQFEYALQTADEFQKIQLSHIGKSLPNAIDIDLLGHYQHQNILTVLTALDVLKTQIELNDELILKGLSKIIENTGLKGRWQIINRNPLSIVDTGHNEAGIKFVVEQILKYPFKKLHFIYGAVNDKNIDKILELLPKNAHFYFTQASIPRALDAEILYEKAKNIGLKGEKIQDVSKAYAAALENADENDFIFVGGSTFVVADLMENLQI